MIIFLYGKDEFRSLRKLAEIKNKFLQICNPAPAGLFDFEEKDWNLGEIMSNISSGGLFSPKKLAIIKNLISAKKEFSDENFEKFLKNESKKEKSDLILIFWESRKLKKSSKPYRLLQRIAKCQEFALLEGAKLKSWIIGEIQDIRGGNISISPSAVERLVIFVGNDLNLLLREIEKLANFKSKGEITDNDVDLLVKSKIDTDIFRTVDALARGDKKTALKLLHDHLESGEDPFYLLSMYFYQFRNLVKVKPLAEKNMPQSEIVSKLKMHPFVVRKSLDQARNFSWQKLKSLYNQLCEIDFASKTGKTDIELALDKFVAGV
ncbi:MAG: DNA polymerase III subunit delta [Candidatus Moranbacteria bacterium RBG_13_45_13]|nr:MAG: DNA polymerase III subunit delta [Candidatus Moranbacteria bacterium RBG_13_45_13]